MPGFINYRWIQQVREQHKETMGKLDDVNKNGGNSKHFMWYLSWSAFMDEQRNKEVSEQVEYNTELEKYNNLNWFKKLFTKKPKLKP